jgi:hypothetical protein
MCIIPARLGGASKVSSERLLHGIPGHLPAHEVVVADAFVVRTLKEDREGDIARMQVRQLRDLGGDPGAALALLGCGAAVVPHEVVGNQLATALERVE